MKPNPEFLKQVQAQAGGQWMQQGMQLACNRDQLIVRCLHPSARRSAAMPQCLRAQLKGTLLLTRPPPAV